MHCAGVGKQPDKVSCRFPIRQCVLPDVKSAVGMGSSREEFGDAVVDPLASVADHRQGSVVDAKSVGQVSDKESP